MSNGKQKFISIAARVIVIGFLSGTVAIIFYGISKLDFEPLTSRLNLGDSDSSVSIQRPALDMETLTDRLPKIDNSLLKPQTKVETPTPKIDDSLSKPQTKVETLTDRLSKIDDSLLKPQMGPLTDRLSKIDDSLLKPQIGTLTDRLPKIDDSLLKPQIGTLTDRLPKIDDSILKPQMGTLTDRLPKIDDSKLKPQKKAGKIELSRSKIEEKLKRIPVFYPYDGDSMPGTIYLSYDDAMAAADDFGFFVKVKCTTLDQVLYSLVLKKGSNVRTPPPPVEVLKAEQMEDMEFKLVPSKTALRDSKKANLVDDDVVPLFIAERLPFAGPDGPQVPIFLEKVDAINCISSYNRLRDSIGVSDEPFIRTTTLKDVLNTMETGARPDVSEFRFYAAASELIQAAKLKGI